VVPDLVELGAETDIPFTDSADELLRQHPGAQPMILPDLDALLICLQGFVETYYKACPPEFTSHGIRPVWITDLIGGHILLATCLMGLDEAVSDEFLECVLASSNSRYEEKHLGAGFLQDDPDESISKLKETLRTARPNMSDSLMFLSDSYRSQHNIQMACITAVAALEAAISEFARSKMMQTLGKSLTKELLREQGMSIMIQAIPKLFFSPPNVVTDELVDQVGGAIKTRNAIMHGRQDGEGKAVVNSMNVGEIYRQVEACSTFIAELRA
jgi:hypothetical protein